MLWCSFRNTLAHQFIQVRFELQCGTGSVAARCGARRRLNLPHSCKGGNCGSCRARLLQGEIHYPNGPPLGAVRCRDRRRFHAAVSGARAQRSVASRPSKSPRPTRRVIKRLPARIERARAPVARRHGPVSAAPGGRSIPLRGRPVHRHHAARRPAPQLLDRLAAARLRACWNCTCGGSRAANSRRRCSTRDARSALLTIEGPSDTSCTEPRRAHRCCWSAAARDSRRCSASCGT